MGASVGGHQFGAVREDELQNCETLTDPAVTGIVLLVAVEEDAAVAVAGEVPFLPDEPTVVVPVKVEEDFPFLASQVVVHQRVEVPMDVPVRIEGHWVPLGGWLRRESPRRSQAARRAVPSVCRTLVGTGAA